MVRARIDATRAHRVAKQQLGAFLLRHDMVFSGKTKWTRTYFVWLSSVTMAHSAQLIVLQEYIDTVTDCIDRVHRLTEQIRLQSRQSSRHELIQALQAMRGIAKSQQLIKPILTILHTAHSEVICKNNLETSFE